MPESKNAVVSRMYEDKPVYIVTLGQFRICGEDNESYDIIYRSQKLLDIFKYLLVNRSRSIPAEIIMENLYPVFPMKIRKTTCRI